MTISRSMLSIALMVGLAGVAAAPPLREQRPFREVFPRPDRSGGTTATQKKNAAKRKRKAERRGK